ncbi:Flavone 3'-O-methyltransferase 1 [Citrus sinensis]|uniref:caffeic acid 3-O-methyltransferase-like isoform X2 n=1 Tax=Citrus sinensis TaxID=2711 RepID=UPI002194B6B9|nr:caffeic acid 3-O-methyltransferase-like isoform X2 [Citrus sinensis]KAH9669577.1 Flavone 3'-O-methyltransferase 1 [Citrus sinensis]
MNSFHDQLMKPPNDEEDFMLIMELAHSSLLPMTMKAIIELGVLEILAKASPSQLSSSEIASQLPTNNQEASTVLDRMLRLLASYSFLTYNLVTNKDGNVFRVYGLASVCRYLLPNEDGVSLAPIFLLAQDKVSVDPGYHLKDCLLEGTLPFMKAHNAKNPFEYAMKDARRRNLFNQSMRNHTALVMKKILEIYKGFEEINQLVDVAGGLGVEHVGGDMFVEVPKGEAIFLKWILHDWSDDQCVKILKNCYDALPEFGKVIVVDSLIPESLETDILSRFVYLLDIQMYTVIPGAKERTVEELKALATKAGFTVVKLVCRGYSCWLVELYK